jgi:hypothetical protein
LALNGSTRRRRGINFIDAAAGEVIYRVGVGGKNPENLKITLIWIWLIVLDHAPEIADKSGVCSSVYLTL